MESVEQLKNDDAPILGGEVANNIEQPQTEVVPSSSGLSISIPDYLKAKTGPGSIDEYISHPLNFAEDRGLARAIRGVTGIMGELNFAVIDIVMGLLEFFKGRKKINAA